MPVRFSDQDGRLSRDNLHLQLDHPQLSDRLRQRGHGRQVRRVHLLRLPGPRREREDQERRRQQLQQQPPHSVRASGRTASRKFEKAEKLRGKQKKSELMSKR